MNLNKAEKIKEVVKKIDFDKISSYPEHPNSKTLRQIILYSKRILNSNKEEEIIRLAERTAYNLDVIVNVSKYVKDEKEKEFWLEISKELFENSVGLKKIDKEKQ